MKLNKTRFLEKFVLATFPIALFVGCSATDTQSVTETDDQHKEITAEPAAYLSSAELANQPTAVPEVLPESKSAVNVENSLAEVEKMPANSILHFADNQYALTEEHQETLKQHAQYLQANPGAVIELSGFSDSRGSAKNNYVISKKRAGIVAEFFISNGIPESQLSVNAYGESFPLNEENNWDENRRVELSYTEREMKDGILLSAK